MVSQPKRTRFEYLSPWKLHNSSCFRVIYILKSSAYTRTDANSSWTL